MALFRLNTTTASLLALAPLALAALPAHAQQPAQSAHDLVRDVMYNELHDPERDSFWEYRSQCISADKNLVREQVETEQGPVFRVIERNGTPLDAAQQREESQRLDDYIHDPGKIERVRHAHEEDEQRLASLAAVLPRAFLFDYETPVHGDIVRIGFRPDPAFEPSSYEERIVHALAGTLTVDTRLKRLIDISGVVSERVDFGYGLLGHIEKGGTFEIHRRQVSAAHWKTDLVNVQIQGKLLIFHSVGKSERESRSDFHRVPGGTTLAAAEAMLDRAAAQSQTAQLSPAE